MDVKMHVTLKRIVNSRIYIYRSHWIASTECGAYGAVASVFATPAAGMFTFGVCGLFAILKYQEAERVIREELDLCLMVCNIPVEDVG